MMKMEKGAKKLTEWLNEEMPKESEILLDFKNISLEEKESFNEKLSEFSLVQA